MRLAELPRTWGVTDDPDDRERYQLTELGERVLDRALERVAAPGVTDEDLVQAAVEILEAATISPAQSCRIDQARRQALDRGRPGSGRAMRPPKRRAGGRP